MINNKATLGLIAAASLLAGPAHAISVGQTSDFDRGNPDGWRYGSGQWLIADGQLRVDTGAEGTPGKAVTINQSDNWTGDWVAAGVIGVTVLAENTGTERVWLRMAFSDTGTLSGPWAVTDDSNWLVLDGGESASHTFLLDQLTLQQDDGTSIEDLLSGVSQVRIFNQQQINFRGQAGAFALDEITTVPVPAAAWLFASAFGALGWVGRRKSA